MHAINCILNLLLQRAGALAAGEAPRPVHIQAPLHAKRGLAQPLEVAADERVSPAEPVPEVPVAAGHIPEAMVPEELREEARR